ncbi:hypothetical protein PFICI_05738 [Pestalotiopsis fici W106-1]|uniref:Uncharacterized protein n=1 Tax=Pestalotiopsis fici (strain W106-1 / CGMCC3.15140) TaxID=1229662 RepID=W3XEN5_PESFW|nr:uncharacterized protein PFICI_05738 [Pestalotiopsis fici W106-1]ETS83862.1 hypothetical protein PFICI_05738 [Pestalotiopsis fici W106-1]
MFGGMRHQKDTENEEESGLLDTSEIVLKPAKKSIQLQSLLLIISLSFNALFAFLGLLSLSRTQELVTLPSYEAGFASDLEPARKEIELQVKTFSGGVELTSEGHYFTDKGGDEFVGQPRPEIDEAWSRLLGGWFYISHRALKAQQSF